MSHQTSDVPELLILPAEALVLHEEVDSRRVEPLVKRLQEDGFLKNPPIAASVDGSNGIEGRYVILDGANRTTALRKLDVPHHLVQVVDYANVQMDTWRHLITDIPEQRFTQALAGSGLRLELTTYQEAHRHLIYHKVAATITEPNGKVFSVMAGGSLASEIEILSRLTSIYAGQSAVHRVNTDHLADLLPHYDNIIALVSFPRYTPERILQLTTIGHKLPAGITRHIIEKRALRVNLPLSILMDADCTTEQKNEWLQNKIKEKLIRREIRYYQESTFLFDE